MPLDREYMQGFLVDHLPRLRAFVRLRMPAELRPRERESDVLQLACVQALERAAGLEFQGDSALANWLFGAVDFAVRDLLKRHRAICRDQAREVSDPDALLLTCYARICTPSSVLAAREEIERIEAAMDQLSPSQRDVVVLSCVVGLSHGEIAAQTGLSADSVRTHLHRGLARLTALVERDREAAP
jgi:RNA polymerase sigma-70 factor (ECF subfamily)